MKQEKTRLGEFEMQLLAYAQLRENEFISSGEIASALDISAEEEWKHLNRMTEREGPTSLFINRVGSFPSLKALVWYFSFVLWISNQNSDTKQPV